MDFAKRLESDKKVFGEMTEDMGVVAAGIGECRGALLKRASALDAEMIDLRKVGGAEALCKVTAELADGYRHSARSLGRAAAKAQEIIDKLECLASEAPPFWISGASQ